MNEELLETEKKASDNNDMIYRHSLCSTISSFLPRNGMGLFASPKMDFDAFELIEKLFKGLLGEKFWNETYRFAQDHPIIFAMVSLGCLFLTAPLLLGLGFFLTVAVIVLICFLCFEGSILCIGGFFFIAIVVSVAVTLMAVMSSVAVMYWLMQKVMTVLKTAKVSVKESKKPEKSER